MLVDGSCWLASKTRHCYILLAYARQNRSELLNQADRFFWKVCPIFLPKVKNFFSESQSYASDICSRCSSTKGNASLLEFPRKNVLRPGSRHDQVAQPNVVAPHALYVKNGLVCTCSSLSAFDCAFTFPYRAYIFVFICCEPLSLLHLNAFESESPTFLPFQRLAAVRSMCAHFKDGHVIAIEPPTTSVIWVALLT